MSVLLPFTKLRQGRYGYLFVIWKTQVPLFFVKNKDSFVFFFGWNTDNIDTFVFYKAQGYFCILENKGPWEDLLCFLEYRNAFVLCKKWRCLCFFIKHTGVFLYFRKQRCLKNYFVFWNTKMLLYFVKKIETTPLFFVWQLFFLQLFLVNI